MAETDATHARIAADCGDGFVVLDPLPLARRADALSGAA